MSVARCEGWLLAGRYRLLAELGRGGTGRVWRAHDELLDRQVAVKEIALPAGLGREREDLLRRTMREARLAARLSHPHIAAVHDVVVADERPWIVLQLVPARSLAEVIAEQGPLPAPEAARIGLQVLEALCAAHADGIVHRDVKPANILILRTGQEPHPGRPHALLTDFGLATTLDEQAHLTQSGMVVGTPAYIAPERLRGDPATARADLWSLGATLYTAVEGRDPFPHSSALAALAAVLTADPAPYRRAGPLAAVLTGLLQKDPARRTGAKTARRQLARVLALHERRPRQAAIALAGLARTDDRLPAASGTTGALRPPGRRPAPGAGSNRGPLMIPRWRQAAALAALIVSVLATTSWPDGGGDLAGPRAHRPRTDPTPILPTPGSTALMHTYPVTHERASGGRPSPASSPALSPASGPEQADQPGKQTGRTTAKPGRSRGVGSGPVPRGKAHGRAHR
ncbi:serine/threonine-protein kinase [Nonomuraea sp. NPDC049709]|uniref:serine/threonine-protein kinase n=1 Tax=Nonomuraea sp. NPDC049709 TaxID=3154736 RepID=UPI00341C3295